MSGGAAIEGRLSGKTAHDGWSESLAEGGECGLRDKENNGRLPKPWEDMRAPRFLLRRWFEAESESLEDKYKEGSQVWRGRRNTATQVGKGGSRTKHERLSKRGQVCRVCSR